MGGALTMELVCDAAGHFIAHPVHGRRPAEPKHMHTLLDLYPHSVYIVKGKVCPCCVFCI